MDPFNNPRLAKRPAEDPGETTEAADSAKQPSESESLIDEARREKIEKLKKVVADGTYHVSAEEVADKLIEHMLETKE